MNAEYNMDSNVYLAHKLTEIIGSCKKRKHWYVYNSKKLKRFLLHTITAFFLQYLMVIHLSHMFPWLPIYPPIGTAFILLYFVGSNALYGLFLGGFCAYFINGWAVLPLFLYLTADIGCGYIGTRLSRGIFSSDKSVFVSTREWFKFIIVNALITCFLSGLLRITAIIYRYTGSIPSKTILYGWLDLWLADLNAILVFSGFFLSWISVYLRREKIAHGILTTRSIILWLLFTVVCMVLLKKIRFAIILVITAFYLSWRYGFLLASALTYVLTLSFLAWFIFHQQQCLNYLGMQKYTIVAMVLLLFTITMLYLGQITSRHYYQAVMMRRKT